VEAIADMGSGYHGSLLLRLLAQGVADTAIGVDLSVSDAPDDARLTLVQNDLNGVLDIPDASLDVVLSLAVLEHLTQPERHLSEVYRILRPGGTLLLTTPAPRGKPVLEFIAFRLHLIDPREIEDHKQYFDRAMLYRALTQAGFTERNIRHSTFQLGMNNLIRATK
jgi:SAM-dependent methyltransferase